MKYLNTQPIERLVRSDYKCDCGCTHSIHTSEIVFRENAFDLLCEVCERIVGKSGKLAAVYSKRSEFLRGKISPRLKSFEVIEKTLDADLGTVEAIDAFSDLSEDTRLFIGIGGGKIADTVKYAATALGKACILIPDVIASDAFLSGASVLYKDGFKEIYRVNPPYAVIADIDTITDMDESEIAASFGNLSGKGVALFDWKISNIICGEKYCTVLHELGSSLVHACLTASEGARRRERSALALLSELNLRSGLYMQLAGNSRLSCGAETHLEHALEMLFHAEERELKRYGENIMLCAAFVSRVYRMALSRDFGKILPAPDNNLRTDCLTDFFNASPELAVSKVRPLLSESVLLSRRHRLNEFKGELLAEAEALQKTLEQCYKQFRRLYLDAGLSLIDYLDPADFKLILPLAPDIREKFTLLTMLKDMGLLDPYLPSV